MNAPVAQLRDNTPASNPMVRPLRLVLITPARNEARYIRRTLDSVVQQSRRPLKWLIISDGSTDGTDEIVREYQLQHDWIDLMRMPDHRDRSFAAKATCFNAGYERIRALDFDVIGNLDADISFDVDYLAFLLRKLELNDRLGVAGSPFREYSQHYDFRFSNIEHVSGACQLFRRECFEEIGGFVPLRGGGIDWAAVTTARMKGWQTRTFVEVCCEHHRPMGTATGSKVAAMFKYGRKDYMLGGHPLWQVLRGAYQLSRPPYVLGGIGLVAGYFWAAALFIERPVSRDLMRFHRAEQMGRLKGFLGKAARTRAVTE